MKLSSLIEKEYIITGSKAETREDVIREAIGQLYQSRSLSISKKDAIDAIMERDTLGGTVFLTGMAIPHARLKDFEDLVIMMVLPKNPIRVEDVDVSCFVIMLTSLSVSNTYLQVLASFSRMSTDREFYKQLIAGASVDDIHSLLSTIYIKKDLTVEDIMITDFNSIKPENTIKELIDIFYKERTSYLPVVDNSNNFLGEVRINDLIAIGIPQYAVSIGSLSFLSNFEPFEKLLREEENILTRDVMKKPVEILKPGASVIEAALKMTKGGLRHLPVIQEGRIVGILNIMDILTKVLRR